MLLFLRSLVYKSEPTFLSRSHPDLARILWLNRTHEDVIEQEIQNLEMKMYDREVKEFYEQAVEKSWNLREIYEEQDIRKLFEEY